MHQDGIFRLAAEQIERVGDADHFIQRAAVHGIAAVPRLLQYMRRLGGQDAFGKRDDRGPRRHQLAHRTIGEREHAGDHRHLIGRREGVGIGARQQRGERGARRSLAPWDERRQHRPEALHKRHGMSHQRFGPAPPQDARYQVRGADEQRHADRDREDPEEGWRGGSQQGGNRAGREEHADRRQHVGCGERLPRVLQHVHRGRRATQLVRHPARQLVLAHGGRRDTDRRRHTGQHETDQQDRECDAHRFSNDTWVTRRCSTRSTTTR